MNILHEMGQIYDKHCRFCSIVPRNKHNQRDMLWCEKNCEYGEYYKQLSEHYLKRIEERRGKRMLTKEKYLTLKEDGKTDKKIMEITDTNHNKLNSLKKEWGLIGKPGKPLNMSKVEDDNDNFIHIDKYNHIKGKLDNANGEIERQNKVIEEKNKTIATVIGASEKLVEENKKLWDEIRELQNQLDDQPKSDYTITDELDELEEQNHLLRQCLKMVL